MTSASPEGGLEPTFVSPAAIWITAPGHGVRLAVLVPSLQEPRLRKERRQLRRELVAEFMATTGIS